VEQEEPNLEVWCGEGQEDPKLEECGEELEELYLETYLDKGKNSKTFVLAFNTKDSLKQSSAHQCLV